MFLECSQFLKCSQFQIKRLFCSHFMTILFSFYDFNKMFSFYDYFVLFLCRMKKARLYLVIPSIYTKGFFPSTVLKSRWIVEGKVFLRKYCFWRHVCHLFILPAKISLSSLGDWTVLNLGFPSNRFQVWTVWENKPSFWNPM